MAESRLHQRSKGSATVEQEPGESEVHLFSCYSMNSEPMMLFKLPPDHNTRDHWSLAHHPHIPSKCGKTMISLIDESPELFD